MIPLAKNTDPIKLYRLWKRLIFIQLLFEIILKYDRIAKQQYKKEKNIIVLKIRTKECYFDAVLYFVPGFVVDDQEQHATKHTAVIYVQHDQWVCFEQNILQWQNIL